jgi:hypothetical protein
MTVQITTVINFQALAYKNLFCCIAYKYVTKRQTAFIISTLQAFKIRGYRYVRWLVSFMECKLIKISQTVLSKTGTVNMSTQSS